jgi:hypothetical protein
MTPDERALSADLEKGNFRIGVAEQKWRLDHVAWPKIDIAVRARDGLWFSLHFDCTNYPVSAPTACLWDFTRNSRLAFELWPKHRGGRVAAVFNPGWKEGTALYLPCDREAMAGHDVWITTLPALIWRPADGIVQYLEIVHELLNSYDYAQSAVPAS